uniref:Scavenger receptor class B member 1 n=1 Tax=Elaeophora elaphi TaxID=1147741 RepID=A0A0R3RSM8_9BILA
MIVERKKCKLKKFHCRLIQITLIVVGVTLMLSGVLMIFLTPKLISTTIYQRKNIAQSNELYDFWKNPDYKFTSKIFVYSVKNPQQVLNGNKPEVIQIGPYVYKVSLGKNVISFGNGSVKYQNVRNFTFDMNASCTECSLTREIWIPNIIFQKFVEIASNPLTAMAQLALTSQQPFLKASVNDILFNGYEDPYLANVCAIPLVDMICKSVLKVPERIGFLMNRNGAQKIIEISTGSSDGSIAAGEVLNWNGLELLPEDYWNSKQAREINGTDGEFYKPLIKKTDIIYEMEYKGISAYRFTVKEDLLDPAVPGNAGFCHNNGKGIFSEDEKCLPKGLLDLSHCYNGTPPILFSFPNFLYADERVKELVIGLNESSVEHDGIIIEIEPQTGTVLRTYVRSQINIAMWKGRGIIYGTDLSRMQNTIVPLLAEYQTVEIGDNSLALLRKMLLLIKKAFALLCFIPIFVGILFVSIAAFIELLLKKSGPIVCLMFPTQHIFPQKLMICF